MKKYRVRMVGTNGHNVYFFSERHRFLFWTRMKVVMVVMEYGIDGWE